MALWEQFYDYTLELKCNKMFMTRISQLYTLEGNDSR